MKNKLQHYYGRKELHFITFSCYQRRALLNSVRAKTVFMKILEEVRTGYQFSLVGYVLMPEHVHLLIGEPVQVRPSKALQVLKQRVSRAMRQRKRGKLTSQLKLPFPREQNGSMRFWQRRFYDFNVYSRGKVKEKLNYMHASPVARKLVKHPRDWPWSSWSFYECGGAGLIRMDSAEGPEIQERRTHPLKSTKDAAPPLGT